MSAVTLTRRTALRRTSDAERRAAARLADAVAEYDAALDRGAAMPVLVRFDQEVAAATRNLHAALVEAARPV